MVHIMHGEAMTVTVVSIRFYFDRALNLGASDAVLTVANVLAWNASVD